MITVISIIIGFISGIIIGLLLRDAARTQLQNQNTILREQLKNVTFEYQYLLKEYEKLITHNQ